MVCWLFYLPGTDFFCFFATNALFLVLADFRLILFLMRWMALTAVGLCFGPFFFLLFGSPPSRLSPSLLCPPSGLLLFMLFVRFPHVVTLCCRVCQSICLRKRVRECECCRVCQRKWLKERQRKGECVRESVFLFRTSMYGFFWTFVHGATKLSWPHLCLETADNQSLSRSMSLDHGPIESLQCQHDHSATLWRNDSVCLLRPHNVVTNQQKRIDLDQTATAVRRYVLWGSRSKQGLF